MNCGVEDGLFLFEIISCFEKRDRSFFRVPDGDCRESPSCVFFTRQIFFLCPQFCHLSSASE